MNRTQIRTTLIISAIFVLAGAGVVWAHGGYGGMMGYGGGYGSPMMGYGGGYSGGYGPMMGPGYGPMMGPGYSNLSPNQYNRLANARQKFFDQTHALREKMDQKQYAIQEELNKQNPDRAKLEALQKNLSGLRSQYDQYELDYQLAVHKILPKSAPGQAYANGFRGGYGYGW